MRPLTRVLVLRCNPYEQRGVLRVDLLNQSANSWEPIMAADCQPRDYLTTLYWERKEDPPHPELDFLHDRVLLFFGDSVDRGCVLSRARVMLRIDRGSPQYLAHAALSSTSARCLHSASLNGSAPIIRSVLRYRQVVSMRLPDVSASSVFSRYEPARLTCSSSLWQSRPNMATRTGSVTRWVAPQCAICQSTTRIS